MWLHSRAPIDTVHLPPHRYDRSRFASLGSAVFISISLRRLPRLLAALALGMASAAAAADPPMRFRDMPPEQRRQIVRERWEGLPPAEQQRIRERIRYEREQSGGSLSREQRQQLRRDVMEHGRDVYGGPHPSPGPHGPRRPH